MRSIFIIERGGKVKTLVDLFLTFFKIGLFTFGGGYAMIPFIERDCVDKKKWITRDEMADIAVIAESTPGPIAINCATYVGYKKKGLLGAVLATIGVILPSFCIIFLISLFLDRYLNVPWVARAFRGIRIAVGILIFDVAIKMMKKTCEELFTRFLAVASFVAMLLIDFYSLHVSSIALMLFAAAIGLAAFIVGNGREKEPTL